MNRPLPIRFRNRLVQNRKMFAAIVTDVEWWNNNLLDAEPFDCEIEKIMVDLITKSIAAYDDSDWDEHARLMERMSEVAHKGQKELKEGI